MKSTKDSDARFNPWQSPFSRVENLEVIDEVDEEVRLRESVLVVAALWIGRAALIWGLFYYYYGEYLTGSIPLYYSILTLLSFQLLQGLSGSEYTGAGIYYEAAKSEGESLKVQDVYIMGGSISAGQADPRRIYFKQYVSISEIPDRWHQKHIGLEKTKVKRPKETHGWSLLFLYVIKVRAGKLYLKEHFPFLSEPCQIQIGGEIRLPEIRKVLYALEQIFVSADKRIESAVGEGSMAVMFVH